MGIFSTQNIVGDLWLRRLDNKVEPSNILLSSIYLKYENVDTLFYTELYKNEITRFDMFYDSIFIETNNGFFFEKLKTDSNGNLTPFHNFNNYQTRGYTPIEYWFDEEKLRVFYVDIRSPIQSAETFQSPAFFEFFLNVVIYDCSDGIYKKCLRKKIKIKLDKPTNWGGDKANIETPKISYNKDTKTYNISFIFRNNINKFALTSINFLKKEQYEISRIDSLIPFSQSGNLYEISDF
jgi:hypothetical protein